MHDLSSVFCGDYVVHGAGPLNDIMRKEDSRHSKAVVIGLFLHGPQEVFSNSFLNAAWRKVGSSDLSIEVETSS